MVRNKLGKRFLGGEGHHKEVQKNAQQNSLGSYVGTRARKRRKRLNKGESDKHRGLQIPWIQGTDEVNAKNSKGGGNSTKYGYLECKTSTEKKGLKKILE